MSAGCPSVEVLVKPCPFCAEDVQDSATICRFCQRELPPPPSASPRAVAPDVQRPALRELRERALLTQCDLAERASVDEKTIWRIENHPERFNAKWATLKRIADALGAALHQTIHPADLLGCEAQRASEYDGMHPALHPAARHASRATDKEVLFIWDLAMHLRSSVRTLKRVLDMRPWDLPATLPSALDRRPRWSRSVVERWVNGDMTAAGQRRLPRLRRSSERSTRERR